MELFRYPQVLAWSVPVLAALVLFLFWATARRGALLKKLGAPVLLAGLIPSESRGRRRIKLYLLISGSLLLFISWSGPQWGVELLGGGSASGQMIIALDTSLSMAARDIKPSRMENAKLAMSRLIDELQSMRIGIVAFSGQAHIQCPLTTDKEALKSFLAAVDTQMLPEPGTSLGDAVRVSAGMLSRYSGKKALVMLTDGEDRNFNSETAARQAAEAGMAIFAVGIGDPEGDLIPVAGSSGSLSEYKKDSSGRPVVSRLDERTLLQLAAATGGAYLRHTDTETTVTELARRIEGMDKAGWEGRSRASYKNRYQIPLFLAWLILLVELVFPERKGAAERFRTVLKLRKNTEHG
ncbi:MAG: VWA domain-containing protein [bacterium]